MAPEIERVLPTSLRGFKRILLEFGKLNDAPSRTVTYEGGAALIPTEIASMNIAFNRKAKIGFWKPSESNARCALDEIFSDVDLEPLLNETNIYKEELADQDCPTIDDAYLASTEYCRVVQYAVSNGLFHNEALVDASDNRLFQSLGYVPVAVFLSILKKLTSVYSLGRFWDNMETHLIFGSPGHPHATILSIMPQRASSQKELLCTEFLTLYWWSQKLARRAVHTTNHCLPVSLNYSVRHL